MKYLCTAMLFCFFMLLSAKTQAQEEPDTGPEIEFGDGKAWIIAQDRIWKIGATGVEILIPQGFVHDKASIPRALWTLLPKNNDYTRATIVHDYLYWTQLCTREQADNLLVIAMKESGVGWVKRRSIYAGVRVGGGAAWKKNQRERDKGLPRIISINEAELNMSWKEKQIILFKRGYRDPLIDSRNDYCEFGNSMDVPQQSGSFGE